MRIFVSGDIHGDLDYDKIGNFRREYANKLTLDDYLIVCGDFGVLWDGNKHDRYFKETVYGNFPCTILWVDGNHENFDVLNRYPTETWNGGKVHRITDRILHLQRGEIFTLGMEKIKILSFGGAMSTDRGYDTGRNANWWAEELPNKQEKQNAINNLKAHNNKVDYIFTHDAPSNVQREMFNYDHRTDSDFVSFLQYLSETVSFKAWYFGHHHEDRALGKFRCLYNDIVEIEVQH